MRTAFLIVLLVLVAVGAGLALGVAFAPTPSAANCHTFTPYAPPFDPDRGSPLNPLRCKPDGLGGMKCSYAY